MSGKYHRRRICRGCRHRELIADYDHIMCRPCALNRRSGELMDQDFFKAQPIVAQGELKPYVQHLLVDCFGQLYGHKSLLFVLSSSMSGIEWNTAYAFLYGADEVFRAHCEVLMAMGGTPAVFDYARGRGLHARVTLAEVMAQHHAKACPAP